jgi:hypothetical protein
VIALAGLYGIGSGCWPNYAPPARALQTGTPVPIAAGDGVVEGGYSRWGGLGGRAQIGVAEDWALEAGLNTRSSNWAMGFIGPRWSAWSKENASGRLRGTLDLMAGPALGAGGSRCSGTVCDGIPWHRRGAVGGYFGSGIGLDVRWFSLFSRVSTQLTGAHNTFLTFWWSASLGVQATIKRSVGLFVQSGMAGYANAEEHVEGWNAIEAGLTIYLPSPGTPKSEGEP